MKRTFSCISVSVVVGLFCGAARAEESVATFVGNWALDLPGGAGWLGVTHENGYLDGGLLWYGGSVNPLDSVYVDGGKLYATRNRSVER